MFYRIQPWFYSQVLSFDKQDELDEEGGEIQVVREHRKGFQRVKGRVHSRNDSSISRL